MDRANHNDDRSVIAAADGATPRADGAERDADARHPSRRAVVRQGMKLAFVVPVISTFFASDAMAAGSNHSCYPAGQACPGAEPCCSGSCNVVSDECDP